MQYNNKTAHCSARWCVQVAVACHLFWLGSLAVDAVEVDPDLTALTAAFSELHLHQTEMDFAAYINRQKDRQSSKQNELIQQIAEQVERHQNNVSALPVCRQMALQDMQFSLELAQTRQQMLKELKAEDAVYQGSFSSFSQDRSWYRHWLSSWLQTKVSVQTLENIAYAELADAKQKRIALNKMVLEEDNRVIRGSAEVAIESAFKRREERVYRYVKQVLGSDFQAPPVNIVKSTLPKSFPAPGIYDPGSQQFIYHLHSDIFPVKHMDWLFLHEAVPGHHFQSQFTQHRVACPQFRRLPGTTLFAEGWAAYVETLGQQLGLFNDRSSIEYALDWQELRAVRVLIDTGIHSKGWEDEQARKLWLANIPEQVSIMEREIKRIRRWPAQVVTYVYGKAVIKQAIEDILASSPDKSLADAHREILKLSNFSLKALQFKWGV